MAPLPEINAPPIVQTVRWLFDPIGFLDDARKRHGELFGVRFLGFRTPMYLLSDPGVVRALYSEPSHGLPPGRSLALEPVLGRRSVLLLEGPEHLARRRIMLPPFHGARMRAYEGIVREVAEAEVRSWPRGETITLAPRMQAITLEVILRAVFGVVDAERRDVLTTLLRDLLADTAAPRMQLGVLVARRVGRPGPLRGLRATTDRVDAVLAQEVAERRADPDLEARQDILSLLVAARFEDGGAMDDSELRDQLMTLLLAGHETTATGLAWTFDLLVRHPEVLARLAEDPDDEAFLRAVCSEALRLRPVVPLAGRRLHQELVADGHVIPAGADVSPAIWLTHTRPDSYPDPLAFRPERFLGEAGQAGPGPYAWIPFGGGVRRCLGAAFAEFEMRVVLQTVARERRLQAPAGAEPERIARRNITLAPRTGTRVLVAH